MSALPRCAPPLGHVDPEDHVPGEEEVEAQVAQAGTSLSNWRHTDDLSDWFNQQPIRPFSYMANTTATRARTAAPAFQRLTLSGLSAERDRQAEQSTSLHRPSNSTAEAPDSPGRRCSHVRQPQGCTAAPRRFTLKTELQLQLSDHVHPAAAGAVDSTVKTILHEDSAMALRPSSMVQLLQAATLIQNLNARSMADSTNAQDRGSNWNWWTQWCKHLEHTDGQGVQSLQGYDCRNAERVLSLDFSDSLVPGQDEDLAQAGNFRCHHLQWPYSGVSGGFTFTS